MAKNLIDINGNSVEDFLCAEENSHGLMSSEDKVKLNSIEEGAQRTIIDVVELPNRGSNGSFYRLLTASIVQRKEVIENFTCKCVDGLPENPEPVTRDMNSAYVYYNTKDGSVSGYVDEFVSTNGGIPVGWYPLDQLAAAFGAEWGGVINDIDDSKEDDYLLRILLKPKFYLYDNRWVEVPFGYETVPEFDITWDGVIGDRLTLDAYSITGREGSSIVKISDDVFTVEQLINSKIVTTDGYEEILDESLFDTEMIPGVISIGGAIGIVYSSDDANTALGLPSGYLSNGVYFGHVQNEEEVSYINRLVGPTKVTKIDKKFLPIQDIDIGEFLPEPSYSDEGKILQVVNGKAAWVGITIAEEASF